MLGKTFLATTALVLFVSNSLAGQAPTTKTVPPFAAAYVTQKRDVNFSKPGTAERNAQFFAWFGHRVPHDASKLLYEQSASSEFSSSAVSSWKNDSGLGYSVESSIGADDFTIPGTGKHTITAIYAPGSSGSGLNFVNVTFYDKLRYNKATGQTTAVVKALCSYMPFKELNGGDLMVDVSSCGAGRFRGGHDYALSVQALSPGRPAWHWQTNKYQTKRQAFWAGNNSACDTQLTPIKTCFPGRGYGPDLAFAIYGN